MNFIELISKRKSVRSYKQDKIDRISMDTILKAANFAPTGGNTQDFKVIAVTDEVYLEKISKSANIYNAPAALVVCSNMKDLWHRPGDERTLADIDASIVTDHMMLAATSLGLGSCWICDFNPGILRSVLEIPDNYDPVNILAVGYGQDGNEQPKKRKQLDEIVVYDHF